MFHDPIINLFLPGLKDFTGKHKHVLTRVYCIDYRLFLEERLQKGIYHHCPDLKYIHWIMEYYENPYWKSQSLEDTQGGLDRPCRH